MSEIARDIVVAIEKDILDRRGLRQELEGCDEDIRTEIREKWESLIDGVLHTRI